MQRHNKSHLVPPPEAATISAHRPLILRRMHNGGAVRRRAQVHQQHPGTTRRIQSSPGTVKTHQGVQSSTHSCTASSVRGHSRHLVHGDTGGRAAPPLVHFYAPPGMQRPSTPPPVQCHTPALTTARRDVIRAAAIARQARGAAATEYTEQRSRTTQRAYSHEPAQGGMYTNTRLCTRHTPHAV